LGRFGLLRDFFLTFRLTKLLLVWYTYKLFGIAYHFEPKIYKGLRVLRILCATLQIDKAGRVNVPKYIRDALGLAGGDLVKVTLAKETLEGKQGNAEVSLSA
jgi:AbrB family looped-hinge helix DNA binding protein